MSHINYFWTEAVSFHTEGILSTSNYIGGVCRRYYWKDCNELWNSIRHTNFESEAASSWDVLQEIVPIQKDNGTGFSCGILYSLQLFADHKMHVKNHRIDHVLYRIKILQMTTLLKNCVVVITKPWDSVPCHSLLKFNMIVFKNSFLLCKSLHLCLL